MDQPTLPSATGLVARQIVGNRDLESSMISGRHVLTQMHSFHHRQLRSQGGPDSPDNLILVSGDGTRGEHGWIHANPGHARLLGYIVPSFASPMSWPIYRRDPYGVGWDWFTQGPTGELEWNSRRQATSLIATHAGVPERAIDTALAAMRELVRRERAGA